MKTMFKRSVSILLSIIMIISVFTIVPITANASSGLLWKRVWYFNREYTIIEDNSNGYNSGYVTLLPTEYIALSPFESRDPKFVRTEDLGYAHSTVKNLLDSWVQPGGLLEKEAFAMRTVDVPDEGVYGVKCYLLNATEARRLPQSVLDDGSYFIWWLRDTDQYHQFASDVAPGSEYNEYGHGFVREVGVTDPGNKYPWGTWVTNEQGVRPAFQIDLSKAPYDPENNALLYSLDMTNYGAHISHNATINNLQNDLIYRGYRGEIKTVKFTTGSGYMFPETSECYKTVNGITIARTGDREITVSGSITGNVDFQIPDVEALPATAPVITGQPTGFEVTYLEASPATTVTATAAEGHTLSYTWYYSKVNSNTGGSWAGNGSSCGINTQDYGPGCGTYYMYCVVTATRNDNGQTASVVSDTAKVVINKAKGEIQYGLYYDKIDKMVGDPDFTNYIHYVGYGYRSYTSSNPNVATVDPNTGKVSIVGVGETTITCTIQDGYNWYFEPNTTSYHLTVRDYISVTATGYSGYWDGKEHGITVNVTKPASGYTVKYGVNWYGPFEPEFESNFMYYSSPTMSNIGGATIYYRVTAPYYLPYIGSAGISIAQKGVQEISDVEDSIEVTYGAGPMQLHPTVSGNHGTPDGKLTYSVSGDAVTVDKWGFVTFLKAGSATIHLNVSETEAYLGTHKGVSVVVKKAPSTAATLTPTNLPYDGTAKALVTVDESTLVGGTMEYAIGTSATTAPTEGWSADIPTATEVGSYYVWNRVVPDENHLEAVSCVIANVLTDYIEHAYENGKVTETRHDMPYGITFLHSQYMPDYLSDGWYFLWKDVSCGNITTSGNVHLVLEDGATLTCGRITVNGTLSIYGRDESSGKLSISGRDAENISGGTLVIHGGEITATQTSNYAAISSEDVTVYAGSLSATAGIGAGIGGGVMNGYNGTVRIYGGSVYAQNTPLPEAGWTDGEGIGAGCRGTGSGTLILGPGVGLVDGDGYTLAAPSEQEQTVTARAPIMKTGTGTVTKPVSYKSASYNESTGKVEFTENTVSDYKFLTSQTNWKDSWFVVDKDVTITTNVTIEGTVNLIICDGVTLNLDGYCIEMEDGDTLNIYGGAKGTGKLVVGNYDYDAGIGCYYDDSIGGTLAIHGCEIIANGGAYKGTPGISVQDVTIYGGNVKATGYGGAGIGSVKGVDYTGTVRIYGGDVTAVSQKDESGAQGNGIGAGSGGQEEVAAGPQVTVTASQITADMASNINDVSDMPDDFVQTDLSTAQAWSDAPQGYVHLLYAVDEYWMYVVDFLDGKAMSRGYYFRASDLSSELSYFFGRDEAVYYVTDYSSTPVENDRFTLILGAGIGLVDGKGKTIAPPQDEVQTVTGRASTMQTGVEIELGSVSYMEKGTEKSCEDYVLFTSTTTELEDGWYVVYGTVTVSKRISVSGDVKIILCDGAELNCQSGIALPDGKTLSIYAQTEGTGKLSAVSDEYRYAAIGANDRTYAGALKVYGGQIYALSSNSAGTPAVGSNGRNSGSLYVAGGKLVLANAEGGYALLVTSATFESGVKAYQGDEAEPETTGEEMDEMQITYVAFSDPYVTIISEPAGNPGTNTIPGVARLTRDMVRNMESLVGDMPSDFIKIDEEIAREWECTASGEAYLIFNTENDRYLQAYRFDRHGNPMNSEIIFDLYELQDAMDRGEVYYVSSNTQGSEGGDEPGENTVPTVARLTSDMVRNMESLIGDMPSDFTRIDEEIALKWAGTSSGEAYLIYNTERDRYLKVYSFYRSDPMHSEEIMDVRDLERYLDRGEVYYVTGTTQASGGDPGPGPVPTSTFIKVSNTKELDEALAAMGTRTEDEARAWIEANADNLLASKHSAFVVFSANQGGDYKVLSVLYGGRVQGPFDIPADEIKGAIEEGIVDVYVADKGAGGSGQGEEPEEPEEPGNKTVPTVARLTRDMIKDMKDLVADMPSDFTKIEDSIAPNWDCTVSGRAYLIYNAKDDSSLKIFIFRDGAPYGFSTISDLDDLEMHMDEGEVYYVTGTTGGSGQSEEPSVVDIPTITKLSDISELDAALAAMGSCTEDEARAWIDANADALSAIGHNAFVIFSVNQGDEVSYRVFVRILSGHVNGPFNIPADEIKDAIEEGDADVYIAGGSGQGEEPGGGDEPATFTITWKNEDGSIIDTTEVNEGAVPTHADPTKAADAQYTYTFAGWTPDVVAADSDAAYTATFTAVPKVSEVTYTKVDAKDATYTEEGNTEYYIGSDGKFYVFNGRIYTEIEAGSWIIPVLTVIYTKVEAKPATYTAEGNSEYYIGSDGKFYALGEDGSYTEVARDSWIIPVLTVTYTKVEAKPATYTEEGNSEYYIGSDGKYYALGEDGTYSEVARGSWIIPATGFTVSWKNYDGSELEIDEHVAEGTIPTFNGEIPTKADCYFIGWTDGTNTFGKDEVLPRVNSNVVYTAVYQYYDGIGSDGYYRLNGEIRKSAYLVRIDDDYYFVLYTGKILKNADRTIGQNNSNGLLPAGVYHFGADGKMIKFTGIDADGFYYVDGVLQTSAYLVEIDGDYYFVLYNGKILKNADRTLSVETANGIVPAGTYHFGADGRMEKFTGIDADGFYYVDGVLQTSAYLVEIDGDYYFVLYNGKILKNADRTIGAENSNGLLPAGTYHFGADGRMEKFTGIDADGFYYVDGVLQTSAYLVEIDGDYYFVLYNGKILKNADRTIGAENSNGLLPAGTYHFGADGKMIKFTGIDADGYYRENGIIAADKGLVQIGDDFYYVTYNGKVKLNGDRTVTADKTNGLLPVGTYHFDENGKMTTVLSGVGDDGYYRENGEIVKDKGLIRINGDYYFVIYNGTLKRNGDRTVTADKTNGLLPVGTYHFDENGKMTTVLSGVGDDGYYRENGVIVKDKGLVKIGDDYCYVLYNGKLKKNGLRTVTAAKSNGLLPAGDYYFGADGKMVVNA